MEEYTEEYDENENEQEEEYQEEELDETDFFSGEKSKKVLIEKKSLPILSKFEYSTLLGTRIKQLDEGARTSLSKEELTELKDHRSIAEKEIYLRKIPLLIQRQLPDGSIEEWKLSDFLIIHNE